MAGDNHGAETQEEPQAPQDDGQQRAARVCMLGAGGVLTDPNNDARTWFYGDFYDDGEAVLTASATPDPTRTLRASGRICAIAKYQGIGFTPWTGTTGPTHRQHLTSATFAADMSTFPYLNQIYLFYSCTNLATITGLGNLSGVRQMRYTFSSCAVTTLDFRAFDPSTLTDLSYCFSGRSSLTTIMRTALGRCLRAESRDRSASTRATASWEATGRHGRARTRGTSTCGLTGLGKRDT